MLSHNIVLRAAFTFHFELNDDAVFGCAVFELNINYLLNIMKIVT